MLTMDAILLGGGVGSRFAGGAQGKSPETPKQFQMLGNAPVFVHCLRSLLAANCFRQIVMTAPKEYVSSAQELLESFVSPQPRTVIRIVQGGDRRQDSSLVALEAVEELSPTPARVVIHDACRPFLSREFLSRIKERLLDRSYGAWVPVVPVVETLKRVENHRVIETVDRSLVHRVQTPQIFEYTVIRSLAEKVRELNDLNFTDDASLCEYYGIPVGVFEGDVKNIKLTYEFEMETLRSMLETSTREPECAPEFGYDIHRLIPTVEKAFIPLGGIEIPCFYSVKAHSDGDVLIHALVDACLGALALGDIGQWFPDSKTENQKRPSADFLKEVMAEVHRLGWRVHQMDSTIILEEPKLAPHSLEIRKALAQLLGVELSDVSVKAKTMEGLGPIGERRAIAAHTVVTLKEA